MCHTQHGESAKPVQSLDTMLFQYVEYLKQISWKSYESQYNTSVTVLATPSRLIVTGCPFQFFQYVLPLNKTNVSMKGGLQAFVSDLNTTTVASFRLTCVVIIITHPRSSTADKKIGSKNTNCPSTMYIILKRTSDNLGRKR